MSRWQQVWKRGISFSNLPRKVKIVEVGARDGLQNEKKLIPLDVKLELINRLVGAGITYIEAGAFVSPKWVPQMADSAEVFRSVTVSHPQVTFAGLTPNLKGLEGALAAGCREVAVFGAASESFSKKNINMSIKEAFEAQGSVTAQALALGLKVRGYVSCVLGCPYEGNIAPSVVAACAQRLLADGCYEVSLGDTIGSGSPLSTHVLLTCLRDAGIPMSKLAVHFHDTRGLALSNILVALDFGVSVVDSSVSGLGGCPYAAGATGNVATEDVLYLCSSLGIDTGIDFQRVAEAGQYIDAHLGRCSGSKAAIALRKKNV